MTIHTRPRDTLKDRHNRMVAALAKMPVPVEPSVYDSSAERVHWLGELIKYQRDVMDLCVGVIELAAAQVADNTGIREENPEIITAALEDVIAGAVKEADEGG